MAGFGGVHGNVMQMEQVHLLVISRFYCRPSWAWNRINRLEATHFYYSRNYSYKTKSNVNVV